MTRESEHRIWMIVGIAIVLIMAGTCIKQALSECTPESYALEFCPFFYESWDIKDTQIAPEGCYDWQVCFDCDGDLRYDCLVISQNTVLTEMYYMVACWDDSWYEGQCMCWFDLNNDEQLDMRDFAIVQNEVQLWH